MNTPPILLASQSFARGRLARRAAFVLACAFGLPGCATITTDDHQSIVITSDPLGATCQVRQGGGFVGVVNATPATILVGKSRHDIAVDCTHSGYYPGAAVLEPHFQDMTLGNILYGGWLGVLVDTSSGAFNEYPRWVAVLMKRIPARGESVAETERLAEIDARRQRALRRN
jgi:hypothetical protein